MQACGAGISNVEEDGVRRRGNPLAPADTPQRCSKLKWVHRIQVCRGINVPSESVRSLNT